MRRDSSGDQGAPRDCGISGDGINRLIIDALPMPVRRAPERDREISWILINRRVVIVVQLVSVVAEGLPEVI